MKSKVLLCLITVFAAFNIQAKDIGCVYNGDYYKVGDMQTMNSKQLAERVKAGEEISDADAVLMQCTYLVNPSEPAHPDLSERQYVWVAFDWGM